MYRLIGIVVGVLGLSLAAQAEIYRTVDANGNVTLQSCAFAASIEQQLSKVPGKGWQNMFRIWGANQHAEG